MKTLSKSYWPPIKLAAISQAICLLVAAIVLDGGFCLTLAVFAAVAYWAGLVVMILRRPSNPTKIDLALVGCGYFIAAAITFVMPPIVAVVARSLGLLN